MPLVSRRWQKNPCQIVHSNQSFQKEGKYGKYSLRQPECQMSSQIVYFLHTSLIKLVLFESSKKNIL